MCSVACAPATAQTVVRDMSSGPNATVQILKLEKTVFPITEIKFGGAVLAGEFGTGFCLDPVCRFVATNYHVAIIAKPRKIRGQRVIRQYLATSPNDEGASENLGQSVSLMKFTLARDLAVFELDHPLRKFHGIPLSTEDLQSGQVVDIYAYPKEGINPFRTLLTYQAGFLGETTDGLLAFEYSLSSDRSIKPGASGGIVVDRKTQQIVGVLNSVAGNGEKVALAVPVRSLAEFVSKIQPLLAGKLFPQGKNTISPSPDIFPRLPPSPEFYRSHFRPAESDEVRTLRIRAQGLADGMRNFIAVETFQWGTKNDPPSASAAYEVQVIDGVQQFRKYPGGRTQFSDVPFPLNTIVTGSEWSDLPELIGTKVKLKIVDKGYLTIDHQLLRVFQYRADVGDHLCSLRNKLNFLFFTVTNIVPVSCFGEVWTDRDMNVLRMSEHYEPTGQWKDYMAVMTYGWLKAGDGHPRFVPLSIFNLAKRGNTVHWCNGRFVNYRIFSTSVKISSN